MPKKFYCFLCKTEIYSRREFKKHAQKHYDGERCPYCNMRVKNLRIHLMGYHILEKKKLVYYRDLAILCKEADSLDILRNKDLKLNKYQKYSIRKIMKRL